MTTNFPQFQTQPQMNRYTTPMFMQPQGNLYVIENSMELANVPMGAGLSVAICPSESLVYFKMYQNGQPQIAVYSLTPFEQKEMKNESALDVILKRLDELEKRIDKKGGKLDEYL